MALLVLDMKSRVVTTLRTGVYSEGLAVDDIHNNVYYTDYQQQMLAVTPLNLTCEGTCPEYTILNNLENPRDVDIDAENG